MRLSVLYFLNCCRTKQEIMGTIKDKRKFERTTDQKNPTNPEGVARKTDTNKFDIDEKTIKDQQNKK